MARTRNTIECPGKNGALASLTRQVTSVALFALFDNAVPAHSGRFSECHPSEQDCRERYERGDPLRHDPPDFLAVYAGALAHEERDHWCN